MSDLIDIAATELGEEEKRFRINTIKSLLKKQEACETRFQAALKELNELAEDILSVGDEKVSVQEIKNLKHVKIIEWAPINNWPIIEGLR